MIPVSKLEQRSLYNLRNTTIEHIKTEVVSMVRVRLEVLPGLIDACGGKGVGPIVFDKETEEGATVGDVIRKLAAEHQAFGDIILDTKTDKPSGHVAIVLNDRLLEALKGLDTNIKDGDIIRLFPVIAGG